MLGNGNLSLMSLIRIMSPQTLSFLGTSPGAKACPPTGQQTDQRWQLRALWPFIQPCFCSCPPGGGWLLQGRLSWLLIRYLVPSYTSLCPPIYPLKTHKSSLHQSIPRPLSWRSAITTNYYLLSHHHHLLLFLFILLSLCFLFLCLSVCLFVCCCCCCLDSSFLCLHMFHLAWFVWCLRCRTDLVLARQVLYQQNAISSAQKKETEPCPKTTTTTTKRNRNEKQKSQDS